MNKKHEQSDRAKPKGGPRTKAGKEKTRLNALTHGFYSALSGPRSKYSKQRARLYRKISAILVAQFNPADVVEWQLIDAAVDALVRKALVLRWEEAKIEEEIDKPLRLLKELEAEINRQRQFIRELDAELAKLEEEKLAGLRWEDVGGVRDPFLAGVVRSQADEEAAKTFLGCPTAEGRKTFFEGVVKWDQASLWNHLVSVIRREMQGHTMKAEELAAELERGGKSGEVELTQEKASMLSKGDMEFILDAINKCNRQFSRAIDSLMRYRESKTDSGERGRSRRKRLDEAVD